MQNHLMQDEIPLAESGAVLMYRPAQSVEKVQRKRSDRGVYPVPV